MLLTDSTMQIFSQLSRCPTDRIIMHSLTTENMHKHSHYSFVTLVQTLRGICVCIKAKKWQFLWYEVIALQFLEAI